nr:N-acetylmuramoyl-L-alanine amidase [Micromonospora sp. DSM 115978]
MLTWLADELRGDGLAVVEHPGWKTRAVPGTWTPRFGIAHATAAPRGQADATQVRIVRDGRVGLKGPIAVACVTRVGVWEVLAAGRCNTTVAGTAGPYRGLGNTHALGVEACNNNNRPGEPPEPWPAVQYDAYARGWAVICRRLGWSADRVLGHKEHTPGHKSDPTFDMDRFRGVVAGLVRTGGSMTLTTNQDAILHADTYRLRALLTGLPQAIYTVKGERRVETNAVGAQLAQLTALVQGIAAQVDVDEDEVARIVAAMPAPPTAEEIAEEFMQRIGGQAPDEAATALVAVLGLDRARELVDELQALLAGEGPGPTPPLG